MLGGSAGMNGTEVPAALLLAWIVLIATVAAYLTGVVSIRRLSPQVAGVVACLEAVIATILAWVLLGEHLSAPQILGGVVVLVGAFIAQSATPKAPVEPHIVERGGPRPTDEAMREAIRTPRPPGRPRPRDVPGTTCRPRRPPRRERACG